MLLPTDLFGQAPARLLLLLVELLGRALHARALDLAQQLVRRLPLAAHGERRRVVAVVAVVGRASAAAAALEVLDDALGSYS